MLYKLAARLQAVKPSPTLAISARAKELRAAGHPIIDLSLGEPDFATPEHICAQAIKAIQDGFTHYTAVDGIAPLKEAICNKLKRDNNLDYEPENILVSCGGKQSFFNLVMATVNLGDEVIIPAPYWVSYPDIVLLNGGEPVLLKTDDKSSFKITPTQLQRALTPETKLFVINSPSNPTGMCYTYDELVALGEVLQEFPQVLIATDDMYEKIRWSDEPFVNILNACPELKERTLVLNGVSKAYAMTGWRIGYTAGPTEIIAGMRKIQSQSTSNPTSIAQVAACAALDGDQSCVTEMTAAFHQRYEHVSARLNAIEGIHCIPTDGTFYLFPNVSEVCARMGEHFTDHDLALYLQEQAEVAVVPGSAFGLPGYLRLSFASSMDVLDEAMDRIGKALA